MILRPWLGTNKPPLGVRPIPGHALARDLSFAYIFNEGSGTRYSDLSGNERHASSTVNPSWIAGKLGLCPYFAGGGALQAIDVPTVVLTKPYSIAMRLVWETGIDTWGAIVAQDTNKALFVYSGAVTAYPIATGWTSPAIAAGRWVSIVFCLPASGNCWGYTDGVRTSGGGTWISPLNVVDIGNDTSNDEFKGSIDYVVAWNRVLTDDEAVALSDNGYSWLGVPDLAAMWAAQAVAAGHPALRRLGLFDTGFGFDRSRQVRWA